MYGTYVDVRFFVNLATDGVLKALTGLDESCDRRITSFWPVCLSTEKTVFAMGHEHDDRRIDTRKNLLAAIVTGTPPGIAAQNGES